MVLSIKKITALSLSFIVITCVICTYILCVTGASTVYFNGTTRKLPIYSVDRADNKISISFDCAYGDEYTLKILDVLDEYNVNCTFFVGEFWADKYQDKLLEISKRGHDIGTHSKTHPNMSKLSEAKIKEELISSSKKITEITGKEVELFRPPYGDYNDRVLLTATNLGLYSIQWDVDSLDWKDLSYNEITNRIVKKTKSGSIILCHNNGLHTLEALPYVLSNLKEKGYEFVPISKLIYKENYTINSFGKHSTYLL